MVSTWYSFTLPTRGPRLSRGGGSVRAQAQPELGYPLGSLKAMGPHVLRKRLKINKGLPILPEREVPSGYADDLPDTSQKCISSWILHLNTWLKHQTGTSAGNQGMSRVLKLPGSQTSACIRII